jgi:hypothetical protein
MKTINQHIQRIKDDILEHRSAIRRLKLELARKLSFQASPPVMICRGDLRLVTNQYHLKPHRWNETCDMTPTCEVYNGTVLD